MWGEPPSIILQGSGYLMMGSLGPYKCNTNTDDSLAYHPYHQLLLLTVKANLALLFSNRLGTRGTFYVPLFTFDSRSQLNPTLIICKRYVATFNSLLTKVNKKKKL